MATALNLMALSLNTNFQRSLKDMIIFKYTDFAGVLQLRLIIAFIEDGGV